MDKIVTNAFANGYERMAAWSDLLDDINLYPVPDADTGRNLRISLAPLKSANHPEIDRRLLMAATGNSGNIAGAFFSKFTRIHSWDDIAAAALEANRAAWSALKDPQEGTMLTVFSALAETLQSNPQSNRRSGLERILEPTKRAVLSTAEQLAALRQADVVDSGALAVYLFFEGFFKSLADRWDALGNPYDEFGDKLKLSAPIQEIQEAGYCIDTVVVPTADVEEALDRLSTLGENVVAVSDGERLKVHLHAPDEKTVQQHMAQVGDLLRWKSERIESSASQWRESDDKEGQRVHIVTDAAGSLNREAAQELGITLLDSYILLGEEHLPESMVTPDQLYEAMSRGIKVTTAQASNFERHQRYEYLTQRFTELIYLCVGSVYTGNYDIAAQWSAHNPNGSRMMVVDTGAASGRLGLIAREVARHAVGGGNLW